MIIKDSFSGSKFFLFEKKNDVYLKKKFNKISLRDRKSFYKQNNFRKYYIKSYLVQSAKIETINLKKNYIILKYYEGLSGTDLILTSDVSIHKILDQFLCSYIDEQIKNSKFVQFKKDPYIKKCCDIQKLISIKNKNKFKYFFYKIYSKLDKIKYNLSGNCHGDLTLSNIIINKTKKKLILIDHLDTFWNSPVQDICKLIQDLRLYWTSRNFIKTDKLRAKIFCDNLKPFKSINENSLNDLVELEMMMTLVRILPYITSNDTSTFNWFQKSFKKIDKKFINSL